MGVTLSAATCLGENTLDIMNRLAAHLAATADIDLRFESSSQSSLAAEALAADVDLLWACGLLTMELIDSGRLDADIVAAPVFVGQTEPVYHSVVIVRADSGFGAVADAFGTRLAINEKASWSGHHGFVGHMRQLGRSTQMFSKVVVTGSHRRSVEAVGQNQADIAAIDHTVWDHLVATGAEVGDLAVIDHTADWPAPPFALRHSLDKGTRAIVRHALTSIGPGDVAGLERIQPAHPTDYLAFHRGG